MSESTVGRLANQLIAAKCEEADAKAKRIAVEEEIIKVIEAPDNGQASLRVNGGKVKITVKRGYNYKADIDSLDNVSHALDLHPPVKRKMVAELDEKGYEWYRKNKPDAFAAMSKHVVATPKKVSVTVKEGFA